jgi:hypothetical protein
MSNNTISISLKFCILTFLGCFYFYPKSHAQYYNNNRYAATKEIKLYCIKYNQSLQKANELVKRPQFKLLKQNTNLFEASYELELPISQLLSIDSLFNPLGVLSYSNVESQNLELEIEKVNRIIDLKKKELFKAQTQINDERIAFDLTRLDSSMNVQIQSETLKTIQRDINRLQDNISTFENYIDEQTALLNSLKKGENTAKLSITLYDEITMPDGRRQKISWVNMPGVSYSYLAVENPKYGTSHGAYAGMNLKYMFTRGKSYVELGVLKPLNPYSSNEISQDPRLASVKNEFFNVQFGQDFYTKHFGRGRRKSLNLYSGYTVGLSIPNQYNDAKLKSLPISSLSIGVELFKSKHVLLDTRAAYYLPLSVENRNTRGILYNTSLNFVF